MTLKAVPVTITRARGSEWPNFLKSLNVGEGQEGVSQGEMQTVRKHAKAAGVKIAAQATEFTADAEGKRVGTVYKFARVQ